MIAFLRGVLAGKTQTMAFLDVGGVGYGVSMSAHSLQQLPEVGEEARVHTILQVREDAVSLYGFASLEEKALFEKLISVNSVGPKVALAALSVFSPDALIKAISAQDVASVQRIPGVGKKTASRIILELKGSFEQGFESLLEPEGGASGAPSAAQAGAGEALLSMGFTSAEVEVALKGAPEGATEKALLQYALKRLGSF